MSNLRAWHIFGGRFRPFFFIGESAQEAWNLINHLHGDNQDDLSTTVHFSEADAVSLDPGGMVSIKKENECNFEFEGIKFETYWDKISGIIDLIDLGKERVPGYWRINQFNFFVYFPVSFKEKLRDCLLQLNFSDDANQAVSKLKDAKRGLADLGMFAVENPDPDEGGYFTGPGSGDLIK